MCTWREKLLFGIIVLDRICDLQDSCYFLGHDVAPWVEHGHDFTLLGQRPSAHHQH